MITPSTCRRRRRTWASRTTRLRYSRTVRNRIVPAAQRLALRTTGTPLARIWTPAYLLVRRLALLCLSGGRRGTAQYARAEHGRRGLPPRPVRHRRRGGARARSGRGPESPANGPSAAGSACARCSGGSSTARASTSSPTWSGIVDRSALTYGFDDGSAAHFGPVFAEHRVRMLQRPGLDGGTADWRLLRGPDRRPAQQAIDPQERRIGAWLELVQWWQWAFGACVEPTSPHAAHLCLKLVAEPARIWLALHTTAAGEPWRRAGARARAAPRGGGCAARGAGPAPRCQFARRPAPRDAAGPRAHDVARIAGMLGQQVRDAGATEVQLVEAATGHRVAVPPGA